MEHTNMLVKASPHIRDNSSTQKIMRDVVIALCPAIVASGIIFGTRALLVIGGLPSPAWVLSISATS